MGRRNKGPMMIATGSRTIAAPLNYRHLNFKSCLLRRGGTVLATKIRSLKSDKLSGGPPSPLPTLPIRAYPVPYDSSPYFHHATAATPTVYSIRVPTDSSECAPIRCYSSTAKNQQQRSAAAPSTHGSMFHASTGSGGPTLQLFYKVRLHNS